MGRVLATGIFSDDSSSVVVVDEAEAELVDLSCLFEARDRMVLRFSFRKGHHLYAHGQLPHLRRRSHRLTSFDRYDRRLGEDPFGIHPAVSAGDLDVGMGSTMLHRCLADLADFFPSLHVPSGEHLDAIEVHDPGGAAVAVIDSNVLSTSFVRALLDGDVAAEPELEGVFVFPEQDGPHDTGGG